MSTHIHQHCFCQTTYRGMKRHEQCCGCMSVRLADFIRLGGSPLPPIHTLYEFEEKLKGPQSLRDALKEGDIAHLQVF